MQVGQDLTGDNAVGCRPAKLIIGRFANQIIETEPFSIVLVRTFYSYTRARPAFVSWLSLHWARTAKIFPLSIPEDGSIVAVGSDESDANGLVSSGRIRTFYYKRDTQLWQPLGDTLDGEDARYDFGISVALSKDGSVLASGAYLNDGVAGEDSGHVRVLVSRQLMPKVEARRNNHL